MQRVSRGFRTYDGIVATARWTGVKTDECKQHELHQICPGTGDSPRRYFIGDVLAMKVQKDPPLPTGKAVKPVHIYGTTKLVA